MSKNPCRNCKSALNYKGRHLPGWDCQRDCEKRKKHEEYLKSKRVFTQGEPIRTLDELLNQEYVMWGRSPRHIEMIKSLQLRTVLNFLENGWFFNAVKKESEE